MLSGIRLSKYAAYDLLDIYLRCLVGKRRKNVCKRTIPPFLERIDGYDVADRAIWRHEIDRLEVVLVCGLYRNLFRLYANRDKFRLDLLERRRILGIFGLGLKQHNWPHIVPARCRLRLCLQFQYAAQFYRIVDYAFAVGTIIHHDRQLYHVLLLQLPRIHIRNNVAPLGWRSRHGKDKRRIQVLEHGNAQLAFRIVALVHHNNRIHLADDLQQGSIRRIGQKKFLVVEHLREAKKVAVFLIDFLVVLALRIGADRRIAEYRYAQVLHDIRRLEVLGV